MYQKKERIYWVTTALLVAFAISGCSRNGVNDTSLNNNSNGGSGGGTNYAACPDGNPCTMLELDDVVQAISDKFNLDNLLTWDSLLEHNFTLGAPANCQNLCLEYNQCLNENGTPKTDAGCQDMVGQCEALCAETFSLHGLPEPDYSLTIPHNYNAFKLTVEACLDNGNDALFLDQSGLYYKNITGVSSILVPGFPYHNETRKTRVGAPVGRSPACTAEGTDSEFGFKAKVTIEGINAESYFIPTSANNSEEIPIKPLQNLFGEGVNSKEFTWARPDLLAFGFRPLAGKVDFSDGIRWVLKDMPETGGIHHLVLKYDNQMLGYRGPTIIETYAPYDPKVKYELIGFVKPRDATLQ